MKPTQVLLTSLPISAVILTAYPPLARAGRASTGVNCELIESDFIEVDGMLDDWGDLRGPTTGTDDAGLAVRCGQTETHLQLAISIRDERIIRTGGHGKSGQDQLTVKLGYGKSWSVLVAQPGTRGFSPTYRWRGKPVRSPAAAQDSLQPDGWSLELSVPLAQLRGWGKGTPQLRYQITYRDRDGGGQDGGIALRGALRFAGSDAVYQGFMQQTGLRRGDLRIDALAQLDGAGGVERVIAGGKFVGVVTDEYRFFALPVARPADVFEVRLVKLTASARKSVLTRYREYGNGGSRDVIAIWNLMPNGSFTRSLAVEVRKEMEGNFLENTWRFEPRTNARGRRVAGQSLVVETGAVQGWNEQTYPDAPAEDMRPILTPWAETQRAVYVFDGYEASGGDAM